MWRLVVTDVELRKCSTESEHGDPQQLGDRSLSTIIYAQFINLAMLSMSSTSTSISSRPLCTLPEASEHWDSISNLEFSSDLESSSSYLASSCSTSSLSDDLSGDILQLVEEEEEEDSTGTGYSAATDDWQFATIRDDAICADDPAICHKSSETTMLTARYLMYPLDMESPFLSSLSLQSENLGVMDMIGAGDALEEAVGTVLHPRFEALRRMNEAGIGKEGELGMRGEEETVPTWSNDVPVLSRYSGSLSSNAAILVQDDLSTRGLRSEDRLPTRTYDSRRHDLPAQPHLSAEHASMATHEPEYTLHDHFLWPSQTRLFSSDASCNSSGSSVLSAPSGFIYPHNTHTALRRTSSRVQNVFGWRPLPRTNENTKIHHADHIIACVRDDTEYAPQLKNNTGCDTAMGPQPPEPASLNLRFDPLASSSPFFDTRFEVHSCSTRVFAPRTVSCPSPYGYVLNY